MNLGIDLNFTPTEKEILVKLAAAQDIQEVSYNVSKESYRFKWNDIFDKLITEEDKKTALGYMINLFAYDAWNEMQDLFDTVHIAPKIPKGLNEWNSKDRKTEEYKKWKKNYMIFRYNLTGKYIVEYHPELNTAEKFIEAEKHIDNNIKNKYKKIKDKIS